MGSAEDIERRFLTKLLSPPDGELSIGSSPPDPSTVLHFIDDDEDDPGVVFVTLGAAAREAVPGAERYELMLKISGSYSAVALDEIGRAVLAMTRRLASQHAVVAPEQIIAVDELAPLFPGRAQALVTDYMYYGPDYIPLSPQSDEDNDEWARLLLVNPIFDDEARWARTMSQTQAIETFAQSGVQLRDVERDALLVQVGPRILPAESEASTMASSKQTRNVKGLYDSLEPWLKEHSPQMYEELRAPVSPDHLKALETSLGCKLPADLREALQIHDGRPYLDYYQLLPAAKIQNRYEFELPDADKPSPNPGNGTCRAVAWSRGWIPFAEDGGQNFFCIDLDPGEKGTAGQVIRWERGMQAATATEWTSFGDWFGARVEACLAGNVDIDDEGFITLK